MHHALLLLCLLLARPTTPPMALDDCGFHFGDQLLQAGMDTTAWYTILGRPDRVKLFDPGTSRTYHIWDRYGIMFKPSRDLGKFHQVGEVFFFFRDLDSPDAQKGLFVDHINYWEHYPGKYGPEEARRDSLAGRSARYIERAKEAVQHEHFAFPYEPMNAPLTLHGIPMTADMDFAQLNKTRHKKGLDTFIPNTTYSRYRLYPAYRKRYTNGMVPEGFYYAYPKQVCGDKAFYWELAYTSSHHPLYLKFVELPGEDLARLKAYLRGERPL